MDSCSNYLSKNEVLPSYKIAYSAWYSLTIGYNKIIFTTPLKVKKGSIISLLFGSFGRIGVESTGNSPYSDYLLSGSALIKLSYSENRRFLINALIDRKYYENIVPVKITLTGDGALNIIANFSLSFSNVAPIKRTVNGPCKLILYYVRTMLGFASKIPKKTKSSKKCQYINLDIFRIFAFYQVHQVCRFAIKILALNNLKIQ